MTEEGERHGGLARAGLSDETEQLAGADFETDLAHDVRPGVGDADVEVPDSEAHCGGGRLVDGGRARCARRRRAHARSAEVPSPMSSTRAATSGRRSTPIATRATASVKVLVPIVSSAMSAAGTMTPQGLLVRPSRLL